MLGRQKTWNVLPIGTKLLMNWETFQFQSEAKVYYKLGLNIDNTSNPATRKIELLFGSHM